MQDLKLISFADKMKIHFSSERLSVGLKSFQKDKYDLHFTFAFNSNSPDVNFHVSRNIGNPATKPKSEVVRIKKETAGQLVEDFSKFLLHHILEPLDTEALQRENEEKLRFICDADFQKSKFYHSAGIQFNEAISNVSIEKRKGRFYVNDNLSNELEKIAADEKEFEEYFYSGKPLAEVSKDVIESGKMISDIGIFPVMNFKGQWYLHKNYIDFIELIKAFLKPKLSFKVYCRFKRAIVVVRNAKTYKEIEHLNKPVIIVKSNHDKMN
jgi:hypothetical protein